MRLRLIVFLPLAVVITCGLFVSASSLVSALERSMRAEIAPLPMRVIRYESECDALYREIHTLSHEVSTCEAEPSCAASPLLCPIAMDEEIEREYQRLRTALNDRCGLSLALMDYAWEAPGSVGPSPGVPRAGGAAEERSMVRRSSCGRAHDGLEARANGHADAEYFVF